MISGRGSSWTVPEGELTCCLVQGVMQGQEAFEASGGGAVLLVQLHYHWIGDAPLASSFACSKLYVRLASSGTLPG